MKKQIKIITKSGGIFGTIFEEEVVEELRKKLEDPAMGATFLELPLSQKGEQAFLRFDAIDTLIISPISNIKMPSLVVPGGVA